jgi:homoserine O-acetyltransferase/O-succinyltransferase
MKPARFRFCAPFILLLLAADRLLAADYPALAAGDFTIREFRFRSGEILPELRMHYLTLGTPRRDEKGVVGNAVLILHGGVGILAHDRKGNAAWAS